MPAKIEYATGSSLRQPKGFTKLLLPSWWSAVVILIISLGIVTATVGTIHYKQSSLPVLIQLNQQKTTTVKSNYQTIDTHVSKSTIVSDLPLLIFWAGVGLIVYEFITAIANSLSDAREFSEELDYVHANRRGMLATAGLHLSIRVMALVAWFMFLRYTKDVLLPFVLALTYASTGPVSWPVGIGYAVGAAAMLALILHAHTILLRLVALRPRLF